MKYLKIAPRKVRFVADMIRGLSLKEAQAQLMLSPRRPSPELLKLINSARANAIGKKMNPDILFIKEIRVDQGPKQKRWIPRARGSYSTIEKKTSHIIVILSEKENMKKRAYIIPEKPKKKKESEKKEKRGKKETKKKDNETTKTGDASKKSSEPTGFRKVFRRKSI